MQKLGNVRPPSERLHLHHIIFLELQGAHTTTSVEDTPICTPLCGSAPRPNNSRLRLEGPQKLRTMRWHQYTKNWRLSSRPGWTAVGHVAHAMAPRKVTSTRAVKKRDTRGRHDEHTKKCEP